jgi:hypothetical protein
MIDAPNLFQKLNSRLFELLSDLSYEQWNKNTSSPNFKVKDLAIQILNESRHNLSLLSNEFDSISVQINSQADFNPDAFISDLRAVQEQLNTIYDESPLISDQIENNQPKVVLLDLLKIYAENWLLQQQIRQSLAASLLLDSTYYQPFLEYCMRFLSVHFKHISSPNDALISIEIVAETNLVWQLIRTEKAWDLCENQDHSGTQVYIDQNIAWILFSGGIDLYEASQYWQVIGNQDLGRHVLSMRPFETR